MNQAQEVIACFTITDSFDPAEITRRTGVQPTESWRVGDAHPKRPVKRTSSRWSLFSRLDICGAGVEEHIRDIIAQMDQGPEAFQSVSREFGGHIQIVGYCNTDNHRFNLDPRTVEALARYSLSIGFDLYSVLSDADGKEEPLLKARA
jgi:hypothetical protein